MSESFHAKCLFILPMLLLLGLGACLVTGSDPQPESKASSELAKTNRNAMPIIPTCSARWQSELLTPFEQRLRSGGVVPLSDKNLDAGQTEIRLWKGFGIVNFRGLILEVSNTSISATSIYETIENGRPAFETRRVEPVEGNWVSFKRDLEAYAIGEIPDQCESSGGSIPSEDSDFGLIEYRKGNAYRAILYEPVKESGTELDKKVAEIFNLAAITFRLPVGEK